MENPAESDIVKLPRLQVNVNVAQHTFDFSVGTSLVEEVSRKVVHKLQQMADSSKSAFSPYKRCCGEEATVQLDLRSDMTLSVSAPSQSNTPRRFTALSPEKLSSSYVMLKNVQPSPVRKLVLSSTADSEEEEETEERIAIGAGGAWQVVSLVALTDVSAMSVVEQGSKRMLLNIALVTGERDTSQREADTTTKKVHKNSDETVNTRSPPASPTTGLHMPAIDASFAKMNVARGGFAMVSDGKGGILGIGGFDKEGVLSKSERYNFHTNCWTELKNDCELNTKRARYGAAYINGVLHLFGGSDGKVELGSMETFNPEFNVWCKVKSTMITPRSSFGTASVDNEIYAVGGEHYSTPLKSAEVYSPSTHKWKTLPSMSVSRTGVAAAATADGRVFAIGGQALGWKCLPTVECYNPKARTWTTVSSMKTARRNASAVSVNGKIYVLGGYNGISAVNTVEMYHPEEDCWETMAPMSQGRSSASAVHLSGCIYVGGGFSRSKFIDSVERYDIDFNQWTS